MAIFDALNGVMSLYFQELVNRPLYEAKISKFLSIFYSRRNWCHIGKL